MSFELAIRVRFDDEDHAGIVYYPRFFDFFHRAFEDFFNDQGHPYREVLDTHRTGWPAVRAEADYHSPLRFGDTLRMVLEVERVGEKSASFRYRGYRREEAQDVHIVTGRVTVVCIDMDSFRGKPIPDVYRALFEKHRVPESDAESEPTG